MHQIGWASAAHMYTEEHILHVRMSPLTCMSAGSCFIWARMCMGVRKSSRIHFSPDTWRGQSAGSYAVGPGVSQSALSGETEEEKDRFRKRRLGQQV